MDFRTNGYYHHNYMDYQRKMKIKDIIIWILFILAVIVFLWYVFGKSPTFEQTILIFIASMSITTLIKINVLETKFKFLAKDFKEHIKHK